MATQKEFKAMLIQVDALTSEAQTAAKLKKALAIVSAFQNKNNAEIEAYKNAEKFGKRLGSMVNIREAAEEVADRLEVKINNKSFAPVRFFKIAA